MSSNSYIRETFKVIASECNDKFNKLGNITNEDMKDYLKMRYPNEIGE